MCLVVFLCLCHMLQRFVLSYDHHGYHALNFRLSIFLILFMAPLLKYCAAQMTMGVSRYFRSFVFLRTTTSLSGWVLRGAHILLFLVPRPNHGHKWYVPLATTSKCRKKSENSSRTTFVLLLAFWHFGEWAGHCPESRLSWREWDVCHWSGPGPIWSTCAS